MGAETSMSVTYVSRFESDLLRITRSVVGLAPASACLNVLVTGGKRPDCLSPSCLRLLRQMLSQGVILNLVRSGWRKRKLLRGEQAVQGRPWQTVPDALRQLQFSEQSLEFLLWLTVTPMGVERDWRAEAALTVADRLLLFLAYEMMLGMPQLDRYAPLFGQSELCRLAWPDRFPSSGSLDFGDWVEGPGSVILEMLARRLSAHWISAAESRLNINEVGLSRSHAELQREIFGRFLEQCERSGRRELAEPLLRTLGELAQRRPRLEDWCGRLNLELKAVSARLQARRDCLSMLEPMMKTLAGWTRAAEATGFVDEQYAAAQLWLALWETNGGSGTLQAAENLFRQADPLRTEAAS